MPNGILGGGKIRASVAKKEGIWYLTAPELEGGSAFYPYLVPSGTVGRLGEFWVTNMTCLAAFWVVWGSFGLLIWHA